MNFIIRRQLKELYKNKNSVLNQQIKDKVEENGFTLWFDYNEKQCYAYTVGLSDLELPDLILLGLGKKLSFAILEFIVDDLLLNGEIHEVFEDQTSDRRLYYQTVKKDIAAFYAIKTMGYSRGNTNFIQVLWPDIDGLYIFQPKFDKKFLAMQEMTNE